MFANVVVIVIGAAFGALMRWALGLWLTSYAAWLSLGTLMANWIGAYIIGVAAAMIEFWPAFPPHWRLLLITGFAAHLVQDHRLAAHTSLPAWYLPLRWRLTATACVCLAVGAWAASR